MDIAARVKSFFRSEAFQQSRPVLLTTFTNKVGSIGLGLIPILLVEKEVSTGEGAFVLSTLKVMILLGTLVGGALSDKVSARTTVLTALLMSAAGLGFLPFQNSIYLILFFGILAQSAEALMNVAQRILLMAQVDASHQKEAIGWMRMVNNSAMIFSYMVGAIGARLGLMPLMLFDAASSLASFFIGRRILPAAAAHQSPDRGLGAGNAGQNSKLSFFGCATVLFGWSFFYELFLEGGAGRLEILHPGEGLRRFSLMMILNTALCAVFSVHAARIFTKSWTAIFWGLLLTAAGLLTAGWGMTSQTYVFLGMFLLTLGELMLGAVAQYTLMRLTPGRQSAGFYYSLGLSLMQSGRILGAGLAFPLLIHAESLVRFTSIVGGMLLFLLVILYSLKEKITRLG